ncbi:MAG: GH116 family glycosyl-hydrolase [Pontiella sp.]
MKIHTIALTAALLSLNQSQAEKSTSVEDAKIMQLLQAEPHHLTPVIKSFPANFPSTLRERGEPNVYTKDNSNNFAYLGMPIGGLCAGQLYLGGDGVLWYWDIFNLGHRMGERSYMDPLEFPAKPKVPNGFAIRVESAEKTVTKRLNRDEIESISFQGTYPTATINYLDPSLPVEVTLNAFSPFVPTRFVDSGFPATVMQWTVANTSSNSVSVDFGGWLGNVVGCRTKVKTASQLINRRVTEKGITALQCTAEGSQLSGQPDEGTMTLALLDSNGTVVPQLGDDDFTATLFGNGTQEAKIPARKKGLVGGVATRFELEPGQSKTVNYLVAWHFPNSTIPLSGSGRWYESIFDDSFAVVREISKRFDELEQTTKLWVDTWYDSTLPYWFLDRVFVNTSILASGSSHRAADGEFYGFEGVYQGKGTCTHVWGYAQAMGRLFPELEIALREMVELNTNVALNAETGAVGYRRGEHDAVDGQAFVVLKSLLAHEMSADSGFLERNWPSIKLAMNYLINHYDVDGDGLLSGSQHNTLDANWNGHVAWFCLLYNAALLASEQMAIEVDDADFARICRELALKGKAGIEEKLFNGEYFIQVADKGPGTYNGCSYYDAIGQSWAYQLGLGDIVDPDKTRTYLDSLWKYNFTTDVGPWRTAHPKGRWYAMPGEGGLIGCTWPEGGAEVLKIGSGSFAAYNNESMNGFEYAATGLMMWHDQPWRALAHTWYMHNNRYHGSKRNPWNEIEWGTHYSRSMASYGLLTAACGFEYHGPKGHIGFSPKITPEHFKAPFVTAEGWGTFSQKVQHGKLEDSILMRWGRLRVQTVALQAPKTVKSVEVTIAGDKVRSKYKITDNQVLITLQKPVTLSEGQQMNIYIQ